MSEDMKCIHYWTVTSECPKCLRAELDRTHKQLNAAVTLLAEWSHAVDGGGAGWDCWDNHYKEARWGKGILRSLIDAEIAKLEPLEDEP